MNPNETVIVIRSLVPGGVAQQDGRLVPGDRLMCVNSINLEQASLDEAAQALKGATKGVVRIGVAKPLPLSETPFRNQVCRQRGFLTVSAGMSLILVHCSGLCASISRTFFLFFNVILQ